MSDRPFEKTLLQSVWAFAGLGWLVYLMLGGASITMAAGLTIGAVMISIALFFAHRNGL